MSSSPAAQAPHRLHAHLLEQLNIGVAALVCRVNCWKVSPAHARQRRISCMLTGWSSRRVYADRMGLSDRRWSSQSPVTIPRHMLPPHSPLRSLRLSAKLSSVGSVPAPQASGLLSNTRLATRIALPLHTSRAASTGLALAAAPAMCGQSLAGCEAKWS